MSPSPKECNDKYSSCSSGSAPDKDKCLAKHYEDCCVIFDSHDNCPFYVSDWFAYTCIGTVVLIIILIIVSIVCCCCKKGRGGGGKDREEVEQD